MTRDLEQLEFLLSQRCDGTLTAEEVAALDAAICADAALRDLASRYDQLATMLSQYCNGRISLDSTVLTDAIREALRCELQFHVSQDLDNQLDSVASQRLNRVLASNLGAQRDEQALRSIHELLGRYARSTAAPVASQLSQSISAAIRREAADTDHAERALAGVDRLLTQYANAAPMPSRPELAGRIAAAVRREPLAAQRRHGRNAARVFVGTHLFQVAALAAAVALAVFVWRPWSGPRSSPGDGVNGGVLTQIAVRVDFPASSGQVTFTFDQSDPGVEVAQDEAGGVIISRIRKPLADTETSVTASAFIK